jgi:hypothetical protein
MVLALTAEAGRAPDQDGKRCFFKKSKKFSLVANFSLNWLHAGSGMRAPMPNATHRRSGCRASAHPPKLSKRPNATEVYLLPFMFSSIRACFPLPGLNFPPVSNLPLWDVQPHSSCLPPLWTFTLHLTEPCL